MKVLDSLVVAVVSDFRKHLCWSSNFSILRNCTRNCTTYSRCRRTRDLYCGNISSLFLYLKLRAMNISTLFVMVIWLKVCIIKKKSSNAVKKIV